MSVFFQLVFAYLSISSCLTRLSLSNAIPSDTCNAALHHGKGHFNWLIECICHCMKVIHTLLSLSSQPCVSVLES